MIIKPYFAGIPSFYVAEGEPESHLWPEQPSWADVPFTLWTGGNASEKELFEELGNIILNLEPIT